MGYYTKFSLEISGDSEKWVTGVDRDGNQVTVNVGVDHKDIIEEIKSQAGYSSLFGESVKWYNCVEDMTIISKKYPTLLFILDGHGEEAGDHWRIYFKGGRQQLALGRIVYDDFDPSKLK